MEAFFITWLREIFSVKVIVTEKENFLTLKKKSKVIFTMRNRKQEWDGKGKADGFYVRECQMSTSKHSIMYNHGWGLQQISSPSDAFMITVFSVFTTHIFSYLTHFLLIRRTLFCVHLYWDGLSGRVKVVLAKKSN